MPRWATGFAGFYRRYAKTWVHALATAALTAFGTLTFVDSRFAALAIVSYVLPPVVLYLTRADLVYGEEQADIDQRVRYRGKRSFEDTPAGNTQSETSVAERIGVRSHYG